MATMLNNGNIHIEAKEEMHSCQNKHSPKPQQKQKHQSQSNRTPEKYQITDTSDQRHIRCPTPTRHWHMQLHWIMSFSQIIISADVLVSVSSVYSSWIDTAQMQTNEYKNQ